MATLPGWVGAGATVAQWLAHIRPMAGGPGDVVIAVARGYLCASTCPGAAPATHPCRNGKCARCK